MKRIVKAVLLIGLFLFLLISSALVMAQGTPPPPPADGHGVTGNQPPTGGDAPIGGGLAILLLMGAAYAGKKIYNLQTEEVN